MKTDVILNEWGDEKIAMIISFGTSRLISKISSGLPASQANAAHVFIRSLSLRGYNWQPTKII